MSFLLSLSCSSEIFNYFCLSSRMSFLLVSLDSSLRLMFSLLLVYVLLRE